MPGSFYERLFPSRSINFIHSSYSVHWLSKVPEKLENNKRNIYITKSSPPSVCQTFLEQFQRDFSAFLSLRSEEIVSGGPMFLTFLGRSIADPSSKDCCCLLELLTKSLIQLGLVEEADVDSFNMPCYFPYEEEVKSIVREQDRCGQNVANSIRAVTEPMLASHFGNAVIDPLFARFATLVAEHLAVEKTKVVAEPMLASHFGNAVIDPLFARFAMLVAEHLAVEKTKHINLVISMTRK
ncbi:salicylate/benzoate carboxyl methyltransferase [Citrus sinensis]|uniref:Salicylate/benzoate carboxyl methyltransferase n=1 Tax=Citrus sinensis TaxID=2711 RepID=A0ACB8K9M8_CITSI|nr:salicylate/benzoate carboxyl methyltransferase [Citrus sinensis]